MEELQLEEIRKQAKEVLRELLETAKLQPGRRSWWQAVPPVKSETLR